MKKLSEYYPELENVWCERFKEIPTVDTFSKQWIATTNANIDSNSIYEQSLRYYSKDIQLVYSKLYMMSVRYYKQGFLLDQPMMQCYTTDRPIFTSLDHKANNVVNMPLGFMPNKRISQEANYYLNHNKQLECFNLTYWRGRDTHETRIKVLSHFSKSNEPNIDVQFWDLERKYHPYNRSITPYQYYADYYNKLCHSDFFLIMRGDKPWTFSFMDCIRATCIPVCIDTFYNSLGWSNIGINPNDIFLDYNTQDWSIEEIYEDLLDQMNNREKILHMKNQINIFYKKYILSDRCITIANRTDQWGWHDFVASKILEIKNNNYKLLNNAFISPLVKNIKNI